MTRPYTPATLAERWECSETTVRALIKSGRLRAFKLAGKLYRIRPEEVERFECQTNQNLPCSGSEEASPLSGETRQESVTVSRSTQPIASGRKRKPANAGGLVTIVNGPWVR